MEKKFDDIILRLCNAVYKQNNKDTTKGWILHFSKKGDLGITKNNRGRNLIAIAVMSCFSIVTDAKLRKVFRKIKMVFGEIDPQLLRFWLFVESSKEREKKSRGSTLCFLQCIWLHVKIKDEANISSIWSLQRNFYRYNNTMQNTKAVVHLMETLIFFWHCRWCLARR